MKKILIVEDDQIVANIYRNKFAVEGYQVEIAGDGQSGYDVFRNFRPDVVLLDLMLPKVSGVDFMKKIRAEPDFEKIPIIVFSNTYLTNLVQEAWKAGATKCLSKANCTPKQVMELVRSTLSGNGAGKGHVAAPEGPATANAGPATAGEAQAVRENDVEFQAELRKAFIEGMPANLAVLRTLLQGLIKADSQMTRVKQIHDMYRRIHALTGNAGLSGMVQIAQMADALEALLKELYEKPNNINASTLRTVATCIDFLALLFEHGAVTGPAEDPVAHILVVDDEAISRRAVTYALEKAKLKCVNVEDPQLALKLLTENHFDLIFLDVDMPGMNGYELCTKLRALPGHKKTPVVFVTSLSDFESRAQSMMSGGNDLIAKPFLFIELAVKALMFVLRPRLAKAT